VATIAPKWRSPIYLSRRSRPTPGMKQLTAVPWLAETESGSSCWVWMSSRSPARCRRSAAHRAGQTLQALMQRPQPIPVDDGTSTTTEPAPAELASCRRSQRLTGRPEPLWGLSPERVGGRTVRLAARPRRHVGRSSAAAAAADWYDELRESQRTCGPVHRDRGTPRRLGCDALAGWGRRTTEPSRTDVPLAAKSRVEDGFAETNRELREPDRHRLGGRGPERPRLHAAHPPGACKFCVMVASRAGCTPGVGDVRLPRALLLRSGPAWGGQALPVGPYKPSTPVDAGRPCPRPQVDRGQPLKTSRPQRSGLNALMGVFCRAETVRSSHSETEQVEPCPKRNRRSHGRNPAHGNRRQFTAGSAETDRNGRVLEIQGPRAGKARQGKRRKLPNGFRSSRSPRKRNSRKAIERAEAAERRH
jgi:hypothetical protein